jgi:phenol 2-monooxygenase
MVVVRPDPSVAQVLPLDAHEELADFFAGILAPPRVGDAAATVG